MDELELLLEVIYMDLQSRDHRDKLRQGYAELPWEQLAASYLQGFPRQYKPIKVMFLFPFYLWAWQDSGMNLEREDLVRLATYRRAVTKFMRDNQGNALVMQRYWDVAAYLCRAVEAPAMRLDKLSMMSEAAVWRALEMTGHDCWVAAPIDDVFHGVDMWLTEGRRVPIQVKLVKTLLARPPVVLRTDTDPDTLLADDFESEEWRLGQVIQDFEVFQRRTKQYPQGIFICISENHFRRSDAFPTSELIMAMSQI